MEMTPETEESPASRKRTTYVVRSGHCNFIAPDILAEIRDRHPRSYPLIRAHLSPASSILTTSSVTAPWKGLDCVLLRGCVGRQRPRRQVDCSLFVPFVVVLWSMFLAVISDIIVYYSRLACDPLIFADSPGRCHSPWCGGCVLLLS